MILAFLIVYSAALVALGLFVSRRVTRSSDFFVAGRQLSPVLLFSTFLAANLGAGTTVGAAEFGYRHGLSAWWWVGSAGIGSLVLGWFVGPRIYRIASEHNLYTVGDYLELRYSRARALPDGGAALAGVAGDSRRAVDRAGVGAQRRHGLADALGRGAGRHPGHDLLHRRRPAFERLGEPGAGYRQSLRLLPGRAVGAERHRRLAGDSRGGCTQPVGRRRCRISASRASASRAICATP